ncbi:hypothetical protein NQ314_009451 [Rhamnusium bicolor]|uniref:Uncharacterized protein n=1 Tax=Rhamnusium bicolor TaxID=1586634 RepID=A0AAV8XZN5_9CUCU|nr:hypothetical protein NQ314_009451 [Rhamnusium bicolor]
MVSWSQYEVDLLRSTFEDEIKNGLYPTSKAIQDFSSKNGISRSVIVIKAKIQHLIKIRK